MARLLYYNPNDVVNADNFSLPGIEKFSYFFKIYNLRMLLMDRTNTFKSPVKTHLIFPIPEFKLMTKSLEDICNERALELLGRAEARDVKLYTFWSGGIDSTLALVSLLKNATPEQKERLVVFLSEESVKEYPLFYEQHIRGRLATESSAVFPSILGSKHIITSGELNDQVFGSSNASRALIQLFGDESLLFKPYTRDKLFAFYQTKLENESVTNFYLDLFDRMMAAAPIPIVSYFEYFWWLLFVLEWQPVYMRMLPFTLEKNLPHITPEYLRDNLSPFFGTEEFQLWSMNNLDKRIKDTWSTMKWPCKDIIYGYTGDAEYRDNKLKRNSVSIWRQQIAPHHFIDEHMHFSRQLDLLEYLNPENDFA